MLYKKMKRVWSHNDMNYIPNFREKFPELKNVSSEELCDRWCDLNIDFYTIEDKPVTMLMRLTLPFALLLIVLMYLYLPFNYIVKGVWGYNFGKGKIYNWLKSLKLV